MEWGKQRFSSATLDLRSFRKEVTPSDLGAVDRALTKTVLNLNAASKTIDAIKMDHEPLIGKPMISNRTGLSGLVNTLRNEMVAAKQDALAAGEEIASAVQEVKTVAEDVRKVAKDMHREAADARAAIGQMTNGAPD